MRSMSKKAIRRREIVGEIEGCIIGAVVTLAAVAIALIWEVL